MKDNNKQKIIQDMRQSRKKMISTFVNKVDVTCSQTIKKQVDSFLATEYKAWRSMIHKDSSTAGNNSPQLKDYFSCKTDNSNTLLMEYVRYIYKEYGIPDPLAMEAEAEAEEVGRERLSDLIKNQRQQAYIQKSQEQIKKFSIPSGQENGDIQQESSSPIRMIQSKYSAEKRGSLSIATHIQGSSIVELTPIKKGNYNEELSRTHHVENSEYQKSAAHHRKQSSDLIKFNNTTGRTSSKLQTDNSEDFLKNSGATVERRNVRFLFGGTQIKSQQINHLARSVTKNQQREQSSIQLTGSKKSSIPNMLLGGPGRNTLMKIEENNNGSNQSSHIQVHSRSESPIKQELHPQEAMHTENVKQHMKFSRKINSLTLRSDQPVPEIYRYCLACENAVLEENIERHEVVCPNFKQMYLLDLEGLLDHLQNKIQNIRGKLQGQAELLQEKDASNMKNLSRELSHQSLNIFKSGKLTERFVNDYNSAMSIGKKWGETSESVNKLRWFIKVREQLKEHFGV